MKRIMIIAAGALFFSVSAVFAQDTTRQTQPTDPTAIRTDRSADDDMDWTEVESSDVPEAMRSTLSGSPLYKGWEDGKIHRNEKDNGYRVRIVNDEGVAYTYHFDKNGKLKDPDR